MNDVGFQKIAVSGAVSFAIFAVAAAFEEALFRGYLLQTFARSNLAWLAILLTSVFFGAMHLGNPNATFISTANTILAGIWISFGSSRRAPGARMIGIGFAAMALLLLIAFA